MAKAIKLYLYSCVFLFEIVSANAQCYSRTFTFEQVQDLDCIHIYNQSKWQVGKPQKTVFNESWEGVNAIVTDTLNPYPVNDTSVFEIFKLADLGWQNVIANWGTHVATLSGYYYVNSDTLNDFGKMELSLDNGQSWIDLLNDPVYSDMIYWTSPKPILSGSSNGWVHFDVFLAFLRDRFVINFNDTIRFKFTFISDNIQTNKDGLMYDLIYFEDYAEGIQAIEKKSLFRVFPNIAKDNINIITENPSQNDNSIEMYNQSGQCVFRKTNFTENLINVSDLPNGFYYLKLIKSKAFDIKKIVVQH